MAATVVTHEYLECYKLVLELEKEVRNAKCLLVKGDSPYTTLSKCETLAREARTEYHIYKEKQDAKGDSN